MAGADVGDATALLADPDYAVFGWDFAFDGGAVVFVDAPVVVAEVGDVGLGWVSAGQRVVHFVFGDEPCIDGFGGGSA